ISSGHFNLLHCGCFGCDLESDRRLAGSNNRAENLVLILELDLLVLHCRDGRSMDVFQRYGYCDGLIDLRLLELPGHAGSHWNLTQVNPALYPLTKDDAHTQPRK